MLTAAAALDTAGFVLNRVCEYPRRMREGDALARTARGAYEAAGGSGQARGQWIWNAHRFTWLSTDAVVKVARGPYGELSLRRDLAARARIHAETACGSWRRKVAETYWHGDYAGRFTVVEQLLPGSPLLAHMSDRAVMSSLFAEIEAFQVATAEGVIADHFVHSWFLEPGRTVSTLLERWGHRHAAAALRSWSIKAASLVGGRNCRVGLVHGDMWPGNVLVLNGEVTGLVDWDQASFDDGALHDVLHLTLYSRVREQGRDLGLMIHELLTNSAAERELARGLSDRGLDLESLAPGMPLRHALVWYWLRHTARMSIEPGHGNNPRWFANNVLAVASVLGSGQST